MYDILDLSHHNVPNHNVGLIDFELLKGSYKGVIWKCSDPEIREGVSSVYHEAMGKTVDVGMPAADYHFHDPSTSPIAQMNLYKAHSHIKAFLRTLDVEDQEHLSNKDLTQHVIDCLDEGAQRFGEKLWLYSNLDFLNYRLGRAAEIAALIAGIWLAFPAPWATTFPKPLKYGRAAVGIWQKTWKHDARPAIPDKDVDGNLWEWTQEKWNELTGGIVVPPPVKPKSDVTVTYKDDEVNLITEKVNGG